MRTYRMDEALLEEPRSVRALLFESNAFPRGSPVTLTLRMSNVAAMANTLSLKASSRAVVTAAGYPCNG